MKDTLMKMLDDRKEEIVKFVDIFMNILNYPLKKKTLVNISKNTIKGKMLKYTLVLVADTALSLPLKVVSQGTPLDYVLISMHFQS